MGNQGVVLHEEDDVAYVKSISYGGQDRWTLIYVIDDQTTEVQFGSDGDEYSDGEWRQDVDGTTFWMWDGRVYLGDSWQEESVINKYFALFGWQDAIVRGATQLQVLSRRLRICLASVVPHTRDT